jgi:hypothetical protein
MGCPTPQEWYHPARPRGHGVGLGRGTRAPTRAPATPNHHEHGWWALDHAPKAREGAGAPRCDQRPPQAIPRHSCLQQCRADWHCAARSPCDSKRGDRLAPVIDKTTVCACLHCHLQDPQDPPAGEKGGTAPGMSPPLFFSFFFILSLLYPGSFP